MVNVSQPKDTGPEMAGVANGPAGVSLLSPGDLMRQNLEQQMQPTHKKTFFVLLPLYDGLPIIVLKSNEKTSIGRNRVLGLVDRRVSRDQFELWCLDEGPLLKGVFIRPTGKNPIFLMREGSPAAKTLEKDQPVPLVPFDKIFFCESEAPTPIPITNPKAAFCFGFSLAIIQVRIRGWKVLSANKRERKLQEQREDSKDGAGEVDEGENKEVESSPKEQFESKLMKVFSHMIDSHYSEFKVVFLEDGSTKEVYAGRP
eukprot:TRINITY_DN1001_c1_g1_i1.p1 TRINITY_DN1001_c1_g1~~TRINITY_DN1001_c1_g1_i1.p1  ORF type:complete len:257 (-),score=62.96 TRINITY_DN1001_c1_g1_i1:111-881(-)